MSKEELIQKLGIEDLTIEAQDELLNQLADAVSARIYNKLTEQLSEDDLNKLEPLMDSDDVAGVENFINSKIPNYNQWKADIENQVINELQSNRIAVQEAVAAETSVKTPLD